MDWFYSLLLKYKYYFFIIVYSILFFAYISRDERTLSTNRNNVYLALIIIPLVVFGFVLFTNNPSAKLFSLILLFFTACMFFLNYNNGIPFMSDIFGSTLDSAKTQLPPLSMEASFLVNIWIQCILFLIPFFLLAIGLNLYFDLASFRNEDTGLFVYLLFFIPCLITDFVNYMIGQVKSTSTVVYVLTCIVVILILVYFYSSRLLSRYAFDTNMRILKDPVMLYGKKQIANSSVFKNVTDSYNKIRKDFHVNANEVSLLKNYSVSLWVTVNNPNLGTDDECMIFRVGDDLGTPSSPDNPNRGCPYIACKGDKWKFVFSNVVPEETASVSVELAVPFQNWNYLVFNYHDNEVDLFVNGELKDTVSLGNNMPMYSTSQIVCIGSDTKKVHGSICEVRIHPKVLDLNLIAKSYNLLKTRNPPVNNLY